MDLRCDWAFKHVMKNTDILKMLLNDFLPEEIESVEPLPNEIDKMRPDDKNVIMDVLCHTVDGTEFIVEMQRKKKTTFKNRMLYYGASMLNAQLKPREPYSALKPVYVICFMDFKMHHETDQLVYRYSLCEQDTGERYNNLLSIYFCELPRLQASGIEGLDPVQSWFYILANMRIFAGKPEDMGKRYAAIVQEARMPGFPEEEELTKYFRNMITEEESRRKSRRRSQYQAGIGQKHARRWSGCAIYMQAHPFAAGGGACPAAGRLIRCRKAVDGHEWPVDIRWRGPSVRMVAVSSLKRVEFKDEGAVGAFSSLF